MNLFRRNLPLNRRSQIAVIITFVIAVIILFTAVFINISKVSQVKTSTSQAVDKSALSLASQLGSMSHYYKEKVLEGAGTETEIDGKKVLESCSINWLSLVALIVILFAAGLTAFFLPAAYLAIGSIATVGTVVISMAMLSGITSKFKEMTSYNAIRESTLFQAIASIQTDDIQLKAKEPGVFFEDSNGNGVFDSGEKEYNLGIGMPEMLSQLKVDRFSAWYYDNRLSYIRDADRELGDDIDKFINGTPTVPSGGRNGLKKFIDIDSLRGDNIQALSYVLVPGLTSGQDYDVTCSGDSCPSWVKDASTDQLKMVRLNSAGDTYDGFINDKLISLLNRLDSSYDGTFCEDEDCKIKPSDVDNLIKDLGEFLKRIKEAVNVPVTQRLNTITQWFLVFYDFKMHKANRTSIYDTAASPEEDFANDRDDFNNDYSHDIYLRLIRDQVYIKSWIAELETLNNTATTGIKAVIESAHGECTWGRGPEVSSKCASAYGADTNNCGCTCCCCDDCSGGCCCPDTCCWYKTNTVSPCAWKGTYYTCCKKPPVCSNGDLYGTKPGWCSSHGDQAGCHSNCGCSVQSFNCDDDAKNFQGQLAHDNTSGPTEVEQALKILRALDLDISKMKFVISALADKVESLFTGTTVTSGSSVSLFRNEIVYAWKDKPVEGKEQFSHLVQVKIDGYPEKLPYVTERSAWSGLQKCRVLNNYQGNFTITTSRYDQDQPASIGWNLQRRKPTAAEFDTTRLDAIVEDIQDNGTINTTQADVIDILNNYAITSAATVHYGTEKSDIKIIETKGD